MGKSTLSPSAIKQMSELKSESIYTADKIQVPNNKSESQTNCHASSLPLF